MKIGFLARARASFLPLSLVLLAVAPACSSNSDPPPAAEEPELRDWPCEIAQGGSAEYLIKVGCKADFEGLASRPLDASIPGARSGKVILDLLDGNKLYFQNSVEYEIHYEFARSHLNREGVLAVGDISSFNIQYTAPRDDRRFLLGSVTYYEAPDVWALEIAPYDKSSADMIAQLYQAVADNSFFGPRLKFHPTSDDVHARALELGKAVPVVTTDDLYASIQYQPLNLGETIGTLKILSTQELATVYVSSRDIVVLDAVPNDISPVAAIVTDEFQTPLSHINVLARNRGTPNMGLRSATTLPEFTSKNGKLVRLTVSAFDYKIELVDQAAADAWEAAHPLPPVTVPDPDLSVTELRDIETVTDHTDAPPYVTLAAIKAATRAFGAKAANYSVFSTDPVIPHKDGFAIPVFYYHQFMQQNGIFDRVRALEADTTFMSDAAVRDAKLQEIRDAVKVAPFDEETKRVFKAKFDEKLPGASLRFRSSTNAEDLDGFPCAGCYDSHTGNPSEFNGDQLEAALDAIRKTWATVWSFRTFEERRIHKIDHTKVAMALLVHTNFPDEEANGVAVTNNIFDTSGNAPGFYVNVQYGGTFEVVHPPAGITSDSFLYLYSFPGQPITYYTHTNVPLPIGQDTVLSNLQINQLGKALEVIHTRFQNAYRASPTAWYGMDVEFKFDDFADQSSKPSLYIKQARPYPPPKQ
jgi:hypothetical protein